MADVSFAERVVGYVGLLRRADLVVGRARRVEVVARIWIG